MIEQHYRPEEIAERLAYKPRTILQFLRDGKLKGIKISNRWRVRESDIEEFLRR